MSQNPKCQESFDQVVSPFKISDVKSPQIDLYVYLVTDSGNAVIVKVLIQDGEEGGFLSCA